MNGIDISNWQADLDVTKVQADFAIIKATEGTGYINPSMSRHIQQAKNAGKLIGLYHFMNTTNAVAQADFFIKNVQAYLKEAILVLDFEADAIDAHGVAGAKAFLDRVKEKTGVAALIYMSASVTDNLTGRQSLKIMRYGWHSMQI
ncbi:TPA: GH25 family lysozyme [Bacillus cereus]